MTRRRMSFRDAIDLVPDDLPDGAFWAMAHEMAGLDYGDGFDELTEAEHEADWRDTSVVKDGKNPKPWRCVACNKRFASGEAGFDHWRSKHGDKE